MFPQCHPTRLFSLIYASALAGASLICNARADIRSEEQIRAELARTLSVAWQNARVEIEGPIHWNDPSRVAESLSAGSTEPIRIKFEPKPGVVAFEWRGIAAMADFTASLNAWTPVRRIQPGEALDPTQFRLQEVPVSRGQYANLRGVLLLETIPIAGLESRQTLLEGQPVLSTAVQKQPDVRRGDALRVEVLSGDISLTTQAVALESARIGSRIRILTEKLKRELAGTLRSDRSVEVQL